MFMASGNNASRADKAMKWAKNTVIGIAILAGKDIVLSQAGGIIMKCAPIRCRMIHFGIGMIGFPA